MKSRTMEVYESFYRGKRVVVTGGLGFVGSQLSDKLVQMGATVYIIDDKSHAASQGVEGVEKTFVIDAANPDSCNWAFRGGSTNDEPVDIVFNLAASVAGVLHNMGHHHEMFTSNIGVQTIPVAVADSIGVPVFVQTSSVCVYDPKHNHPSFEELGGLGSPDKANAGYAWAKRMGEQAVHFSGIKRPVIVRPSNVFGPGDHFDDKAHVIPALMKRAVLNDVIDCYGDPAYIREFIFSQDVADGMVAAGAAGKPYREYNIGTNRRNTISMGQLAEMIAMVCGVADKKIVWHSGSGGGDPLRWSNADLARTELDWVSEVELIDGLKYTFQWAVGYGRIK